MKKMSETIYNNTIPKKNKINKRTLNNILTTKKKKISLQLLGNIISSNYFVYENTLIYDLADELNNKQQIMSLAVLNFNNEIIGLINRKIFFEILGKPFGRDIYKYKSIKLLTLKVNSFFYKLNIFSISKEIIDQMTDSYKISYYLLYKEENKYYGIFSNIDLLKYLSKMTYQDIQLAKNIQQNLVNENLYIKEPEYHIIFKSFMAKEVGGDFYFYKKYSDKKIILSLCDVSGKGISAALVTTFLYASFNLWNFENGIDILIEKLNQDIFNNFNSEKFVTGIFADIDLNTGKLHIIDMGHSYIYLYRDSVFYKLDTLTENLPIGILGENNSDISTIQLLKNDIIFITSDGLIEQTNDLGEEFGVESILGSFTINENENIQNISNKLFEYYRKFSQSAPQLDDVTYCIFKYI